MFRKKGVLYKIFYIKVNKIWIDAIFLTVHSRANFLREMALCRELLFQELISISFRYMQFCYMALQLSLLKVDYTEIMK